MNLSRKTVMLIQFVIVPLSGLVHGLIALLLCSLVQGLAAGPIGIPGFAIPTIVATVFGGVAGWLRLGETEFE